MEIALNIYIETLETCGAEIDSWQIIISIYFYLSNHLKVTKSTKKVKLRTGRTSDVHPEDETLSQPTSKPKEMPYQEQI